MNLGPTTDWLDSIIHNEELKWPIIIGEAIDNSFDARGNWISLDFHAPASLTIKDDGCGCPDLEVMLRAGRRLEHPGGGGLGRYRIGLKELLIRSGHGATITSIHNGQMFQASVSWDRIRDTQDWDVPDPLIAPADEDQIGTTIVIHPLRIKPPSDFDSLIRRLGETYAPAIRHPARPRQIRVRGNKKGAAWVIVPALPEPALEMRSEKTIDFGSNLQAHVIMGIISDPSQRRRKGMSIAYDYRVIMSNTSIGLGDQPTQGLYGFCTLLGKGWGLSKNKNAIKGAHRELLDDVVPQYFAEVIEASYEQQYSVLLDNLNATLRTMGEELRRKKAKRNRLSPPLNPGTKTPTGRGGKHKRAAIEQPGHTFGNRQDSCLLSELKVEFDHLGNGDDPLFTTFQVGVKFNTVTFNLDNPVCQFILSDMRIAALAALLSAAPHLARSEDFKKWFPEMAEEQLLDRVPPLASKLISAWVRCEQPELEVVGNAE